MTSVSHPSQNHPYMKGLIFTISSSLSQPYCLASRVKISDGGTRRVVLSVVGQDQQLIRHFPFLCGSHTKWTSKGLHAVKKLAPVRKLTA